MLDRLAARSVPLIWLFAMWERLSPSNSDATTFAFLVGGLVLVLLFWALGVVANASRRPRHRTPYDRLHESPRSGFSAWDQNPEGGLHPPAAVRWIVMTFGRRNSTWLYAIEPLIFIGAVALAWLLSRHPEAFRSNMPAWLAERSSPQSIFLIALAVVMALSIRAWAVEQRSRLVHSVTPRSLAVAAVFLVAFAAFIGMMLGDLFGFGLLWGSAGAVGLVAIAFLSPWRDRLSGAVFGKRILFAS